MLQGATRRMIAVILAACAAGCASRNPRCADAIAHQRAQPWGSQMPAYAAERCAEDHWSDAAVDCYLQARTLEQSQDCMSLLTPAQQQAMTARMGHGPPSNL